MDYSDFFQISNGLVEKVEESYPTMNIFNLEFGIETTMHRVAGIIYDKILGLDISRIKAGYDNQMKEFSVLQMRNGNYFPFFSIRIPYRNFISPSILESKMTLCISPTFEIKNINSFLEEIKNQVNLSFKV